MELREIIKRNGIKQSWIAKKLGISGSYLSMILNRKRRLTEKMKDDFSQLLDRIEGEHR
jgi:transcriptional regulator with XRE-family HTH domain|tara:strand:- start:7248 stop:7424 length:177 start_codon:yes stop_codon:yes gene_type:complete